VLLPGNFAKGKGPSDSPMADLPNKHERAHDAGAGGLVVHCNDGTSFSNILSSAYQPQTVSQPNGFTSISGLVGAARLPSMSRYMVPPSQSLDTPHDVS